MGMVLKMVLGWEYPHRYGGVGCGLGGEGGHTGDKDRAWGTQVDSHSPPSPQGSGVPLHRHPEGETGHGTGGSGDAGGNGSTDATGRAGGNGGTMALVTLVSMVDSTCRNGNGDVVTGGTGADGRWHLWHWY